MATQKKSGESSGGTVAEAREKGAELVSAAQQQAEVKAEELRGEAAFQIREQVDQRSTQMGEQVQAVGKALRSGIDQLRSEGKGTSAEFVDNVAQRADSFGNYLQSSDADRILGDLEDFARRRPWLTAGAAAVAGFMASRFVKASSDRRYESSQGNGRPRSHPARRSLPAGARE